MKHFSILIILFFINSELIAQNSDSLFQVARNYAFSDKKPEARTICKKILSFSPDYADVKILLGRTYAWDNLYDSARFFLKQVIAKDKSNIDAINALIDTELWADNFSQAISVCDSGLVVSPKNEDFLYKKARALKNLKQYDEAETVLNTLLAINPNHQKAKDLLKQIKIEKVKNEVSISYTFDKFDGSSRDPWHFISVDYTRKTPIGSVIWRINLANRFNVNGWQYEIDAYPNLGKHNYGYLNVGYSEAGIFPQWRLGGELYQSLPKSFEVSAGFRFLQFSASNVTIYTVYAGKYIGNFWFSLRSFITPSSTGTSVSGQFLVRKYFSDADTYIGFQIGYGISPDDSRKTVDSQKSLTLKSSKAKISYNKKIADFWLFKISLAYEKEEYYQETYHNIYTFDISITKRF